MIEVEVEQCEALASANPLERLFELFVEQHPIGQVGQGIVVRQVCDPLIRTPALRHVFDNTKQILWFSLVITDDEPPCSDEAKTLSERIDWMLVDEQKSIRLHQFLVMLSNLIGRCLRPNFVRSLANDLVARSAKILLAGLIDQNVSPIADVFHDNRRRHVVDDLIQEFSVAVALLLVGGEFIITLRLAYVRPVPVGRGTAPPRPDCPGRSVCARICEFAMDKILITS